MNSDIKKKMEDLEKARDERVKTDSKDGLIRKNDGSLVKRSINNVYNIIARDENLKHLFRINAFTENVELYKNLDVFKLKPGEESKATIQIMAYIEKNYGVCFDENTLENGKAHFLNNESYDHEYNPIKDHIEKVKWDGKKRLDTFFIDYLGAADTAYTRQVTRKWLIGAVGRVYAPGLKFELVPVLVGSQGIGKSTLCSALCPKDAQGDPDYFLDNLPSMNGDNKDNYMLLHNAWLVEVAELGSMKKSKIESTKQFISQRKDMVRLPYGKSVVEFKRKNAFIGTTNEPEFLTDMTGNRRFLPIKCSEQKPKLDVFNIDNSYIHQVLAEALHAFKAGEKPMLDKEITSQLADIQDSYMVTDWLTEMVKEYAALDVPEDWEDWDTNRKSNYFAGTVNNSTYWDSGKTHPIKRFSTNELLNGIYSMHENRYKDISSKRIAAIMQNVPGFEKKRIRMHGRNVQGYVRTK